MPLILTEPEARVLGSLIEKELTTPDYYPLTLNALLNACNQKSNRDPVVSYDDSIVLGAIDRLRDKRLALVITGAEHRVPKYGHRAYETLNLGRRELSLLCVLLLRGPQTVGELKERTSRMHEFDDLETVESVLSRLASLEPQPVVVRLERQPGMREARWAHLLSDQAPPRPAAATAGAVAPSYSNKELAERVERLESELARLRAEFEALRNELT
jgi:uncharacterized protein YceH (UPF0502 family)